METTSTSASRKKSEPSYLAYFEKFARSLGSDKFELRAADHKLYLKDLSDSSLISNDESREAKRQAAIPLIQEAIRNDFLDNGRDPIPVADLFVLLAQAAKVKFESPMKLADFAKFQPFVAAFDTFRKQEAAFEADRRKQESTADPAYLAYQSGLRKFEDVLKWIKGFHSDLDWIESVRLYARVGERDLEKTTESNHRGALSIHIGDQAAKLFAPLKKQSWSEFENLCHAHEGQCGQILPLTFNTTSALCIPICLLGAWAEFIVEDGLAAFVNRLNHEIGLRDVVSLYFDHLQELKEGYEHLNLVEERADMKGKGHNEILALASNSKNTQMFILHTPNHAMVCGWTRDRPNRKYWFLDPSNGFASFSTQKAITCFLDDYLQAGHRLGQYAIGKTTDGFHYASVDLFTKQNSNFGSRKNTFMDMLGLGAMSSSPNPTVTTTTSSSKTSKRASDSTRSSGQSSSLAATSASTTKSTASTTSTTSTAKSNPNMATTTSTTTQTGTPLKVLKAPDLQPSMVRSPQLKGRSTTTTTTTSSAAASPNRSPAPKPGEDKP